MLDFHLWFMVRDISQNLLANKTFAPSLSDLEMLLFGASSSGVHNSGDCSDSPLPSILPSR